MNKKRGIIMLEAIISLLLVSMLVIYSQSMRMRLVESETKSEKDLELIKKYVLIKEREDIRSSIDLGDVDESLPKSLEDAIKECVIRDEPTGYESIEFGNGVSASIFASTIICGDEELKIERLLTNNALLPDLMRL